MANELSALEGVLAAWAVAQYQADQPAIVAFITKEEDAFQAAIVSALKATPPGGLIGLLVKNIEGWAEAFVAAQFATYGPTALYQLGLSILQSLATKV